MSLKQENFYVPDHESAVKTNEGEDMQLKRKALEIRQLRQQQEQEKEQILNEQFAHVEHEIVLLLKCACRCVDKAYGIKGYSINKPQLVGSVLVALMEKIKLDVCEQTWKEGFHQLNASLEAVGDAINEHQK